MNTQTCGPVLRATIVEIQHYYGIFISKNIYFSGSEAGKPLNYDTTLLSTSTLHLSFLLVMSKNAENTSQYTPYTWYN